MQKNICKTVLITGGSRGIGAATARVFALNGYSVAIGYHKSNQEAQDLIQLFARNNCHAIAICADLSSPTQAESLVSQAMQAFGHLDVLVNNAGISHYGLFSDTTQADWEHLCAINVSAALSCTRAVLPGMLKRRCGKIINISSIWGQAGASCEVLYSTAKAALIGFTKALAKEVAPSGICVNCVAPGAIDTSMNSHLSSEEQSALAAQIPCGRLGAPLEIAQAIYFLASDHADYITGQILCPNGGLYI